MASSSSSKAAKLPEWRKTLYGVPEKDRCDSQAELVRGLALVQYQESHMLLGGYSCVSDIDPVKKDLLSKSIPIGQVTESLLEFKELACSRHVPESPQKALLVVSVMLSQSADWAINLLRFSLEPQHRGHWYDMSEASLPVVAALMAAWQPKWPELKGLGCDALLNDITGSDRITIDRLQLWSEGIIVAEQLYTYVLRTKSTERLVYCMDNAVRWLKNVAKAPQRFLLHLAQEIVTAVIKVSIEFPALQNRTSAVYLLFNNKREEIYALLATLFETELTAARGARPPDPERVADAAYSLGMIAYQIRGRNERYCRDLHKEAKGALATAKAYLPPEFYRSIQFHVDTLETMMKEKGSSGKSEGVMFQDRTKLDNCCAGCGGSGREYPLKFCAQCRKVSYCSIECQKKDWKKHKKVCKGLAEAAEKE